MNTKLLKILLSILFVFLWTSCEDPEDNNSDSGTTSGCDGCEDSRGEDLNGYSDPLASLFFDLTNESLEYTYDFYSISGIGYANTIDLPCSIRETDVVSFYTFPDYLIESQGCQYEDCGWCSGVDLNSNLNQEEAEIACDSLNGTWLTPAEDVSASDIYADPSPLDETYGGQCSCQCLDSDGYAVDCNSNNAVATSYSEPAAPAGGACQNSLYTTQSDCEMYGWIWFTGTIDCSLMDANQDCVMEDEIDADITNIEEAEFSISYTNLEKLFWDKEAGRYKPQVSNEIVEEVTLTDDSDVYDVKRYWSVINEWDAENIDGMVYIDHSQWNDTTIVVEEEPIYCEDINVETDCTTELGCEWDVNGDSCWPLVCSLFSGNQDGCESAGSCLWINDTCQDGQYPVSVDIVIDQTFEYTASILNPDSLMFRINSDCDNNGEWTAAEDYEDVGIDGCADEYEDGNGGCLITPDATESDPNGDNYNCGIDGICPCDIDYTGPDTNEGGLGTECNGQYDCQAPYCNIELSGDFYVGEPFVDRSDNLPSAEIFWDTEIGDTGEGNGIWMGEELEPWADLNCNLIYDELSDGSGNGIWDDDEIYQDFNFNGIWDEGEPLYKSSDTPNQLIVNYDTNGDGIVDESDGPPEAISEIDPDEINSVMAYLNGGYVQFDDIIKEESYSDYKYYTYTPIAAIETFFSNQIIEDVPPPLITDQYNIAKTYWPTLPNGTDVNGDGIADRYYDYDYHLFKYDDESPHQNLLKLIHPAYYYEPGFHYTPDAIDEGFFEIADLLRDTMIYASGNDLRQGELVVTSSTDSVDVTGDGTYNHVYDVTKRFEVEFDTLNVPLRKVLGSLSDDVNGDCSEGQVLICAADGKISCPDAGSDEWTENDCGEYIKEINQCSSDSTLYAYKVIRTKTSVLHGPGTEYGERNTVWLSEGLGIIKDKLEIRWTGENGNMDNWVEFSRLELKSTEQSESGFNLGRLFNSGKIININNFENEGSFNNDPYIPQPTAILQRVRVNND